MWARQDHNDWVRFYNALNDQEGSPDKDIEFHWADFFPIRTPSLLRCAIVEPGTVPLLCQSSYSVSFIVANIAQIVHAGNKISMWRMTKSSFEFLITEDTMGLTY